LQEANELLEYWSEHPPAHILLAAMMKTRPLRKMPGLTCDLSSAVTMAGGNVSSAPTRAICDILKSDGAQ